jgi:hypothetical protein
MHNDVVTLGLPKKPNRPCSMILAKNRKSTKKLSQQFLLKISPEFIDPLIDEPKMQQQHQCVL